MLTTDEVTTEIKQQIPLSPTIKYTSWYDGDSYERTKDRDYFPESLLAATLTHLDKKDSQGFSPLEILMTSHNIFKGFWGEIHENDAVKAQLRTLLLRRCETPTSQDIDASLRQLNGKALLTTFLSSNINYDYERMQFLKTVFASLYPAETLSAFSPDDKRAFLKAICPALPPATTLTSEAPETILHRLLRLNLAPHLMPALATPDYVQAIIEDNETRQLFALNLTAIHRDTANLAISRPGQDSFYSDYRSIKNTSALALLIAGRHPCKKEHVSYEPHVHGPVDSSKAEHLLPFIHTEGFLENIFYDLLLGHQLMDALNSRPLFDSNHPSRDCYQSVWHTFLYYPCEEKTAILKKITEHPGLLTRLEEHPTIASRTLRKIDDVLARTATYLQAKPTLQLPSAPYFTAFQTTLSRVVARQAASTAERDAEEAAAAVIAREADRVAEAQRANEQRDRVAAALQAQQAAQQQAAQLMAERQRAQRRRVRRNNGAEQEEEPRRRPGPSQRGGNH